ncbi:MAG: hypothetical protein LBF28_03070, partial [Rickettsiales bacterium]|nr:hypothetical protein [Rickettsiales bacterium]
MEKNQIILVRGDSQTNEFVPQNLSIKVMGVDTTDAVCELKIGNTIKTAGAVEDVFIFTIEAADIAN